MGTVIVGTGSYLPERVVSNDDIETWSGYDRAAKGVSLDVWARQRHGGRSRRWVAKGQATSDLATEAARRALADARVDAEDVDLILLSTFTGDHRLPTTAGQVQANLKSKAKFLQLDTACTGFIDAALVGTGLLNTAAYHTCLVIAADILSMLHDPRDFLPQTVFGDGAGAVVLRTTPDDGYGFRSFSTGSDGDRGDYVFVPGGGSRAPLQVESLQRGEQYWRFRFSDIHPWALDRMVRSTHDALQRAGITLDQVAWIVPHQASERILREFAERMGVPESRMVITYPDHGNLSGASIPVALDVARRRGLFHDGDWLVFAAVGAGMAWGTAAYRWRALPA
jgi:3-oxoacyl-[acyl-carrier-protein] synthase III